MRKVIDYVKENKKIIIVVLLIVILISAVYVIDKAGKGSAKVSGTFTEKTSSEIKLGEILSHIEGVGETDVMISENEEKILGVVIVCEGADNIMTRSNIINAVSIALDIDKNLIAIYSMSN